MIKVFFSYSHSDESSRNELEKHLTILKRDGLIETWHDRRILSGKVLNNEIDQNLIGSNLILLLVSPDFLVSEYCYSNEMKKAFEMRKQGYAWVIPIILDHCDWKHTQLADLLACPKDGKPISDYPNPNKAFTEITQEIRRVIEEILSNQPKIETSVHTIKTSLLESQPKSKLIVDNMRSSNLRIKKIFTDYERDKFQKDAFEYIAKYFNNSLEELKIRNSDISFACDKELNKFYVTIYRSGNEIASCLIMNRIDNCMFGGITYSYGKDEHSTNFSLNVENDGYSLFLKSTWNITGENEPLSMKGAAELYWKTLIERLQN